MDQSSGSAFLPAELAAGEARRPGVGAGRKQRQSRPSNSPRRLTQALAPASVIPRTRLVTHKCQALLRKSSSVWRVPTSPQQLFTDFYPLQSRPKNPRPLCSAPRVQPFSSRVSESDLKRRGRGRGGSSPKRTLSKSLKKEKKKQLERGSIYLYLWFEETPFIMTEKVSNRSRKSWSHQIHSKEAESRQKVEARL